MSASHSTSGQDTPAAREKLWLSVLLLIQVLLSFPFLGIAPVAGGREAATAAELMSADGFAAGFGHALCSPPLYSFATVLARHVSGGENEYALRLVAAISGIVAAALFFRSVLEIAGLMCAILGTLLLESSFGFVRFASLGDPAMLSLALGAGAVSIWLSAWVRMRRDGERDHNALRQAEWRAGMLAAFAGLSGGIPALIAPLAFIVAVEMFDGGVDRVRALACRKTILVSLAGLLWPPLAIWQSAGCSPVEAFGLTPGAEFSGSMVGRLLAPLFVGAPWSILLVVYLVFLVRDCFARRREAWLNNRFLPSSTWTRVGVQTGLLWCGVGFGGWLLFGARDDGFLLFALPGAVLALSARFTATWERLSSEGRLGVVKFIFRYETWSWGVLVWLLASLAGALAWFGGDPASSFLSLCFGPEAAGVLRDNGWLFALGFVCCSGGSLVLWLRAYRLRSEAMAAWAGFLFVALLVAVYGGFVHAACAERESDRRFATALAERMPADLPLTILSTPGDRTFDSFLFYFERPVRTIDPADKLPAGVYLAHRGQLKGRLESMKELGSGVSHENGDADRLVVFRVK